MSKETRMNWSGELVVIVELARQRDDDDDDGSIQPASSDLGKRELKRTVCWHGCADGGLRKPGSGVLMLSSCNEEPTSIRASLIAASCL